jgi:hypothetical protein
MGLGEHPDWVPAAVAAEACRILAKARSDDGKELIRRLLTDQRMKRVWRELANPKRCPASSAARYHWPDGMAPKNLSNQEVAVALFFFHSHANAVNILPVKITKWRSGHKLRLRYVKELRQARDCLWLNWFEDPGAEKHDAAISAAAKFYESSEMQLFTNPPVYLVDRFQGDPKLRTYALKMTADARRLFGRSLYGTIATVTNVALVKKNQAEVLRFNVENWCEAAIRLRDRFRQPEL